MPRKRLAESLESLHKELEETGPVDAEGREQLGQLMDDIRDLLERSGDADEHASLAERLAQAARRFEKEHPALTGAVNRVATALSNLGI
jgi:predicted transcriptional regulator